MLLAIRIVSADNLNRRILMRYCIFAALVLLVGGFAFAADVDGKWTTTMPGMDGNEMTLGYTFKAEGTTLTGTHTGPDGNEIPITNGKIDGNNISFTITIDMMGQEMKLDHKGVVSADEIKLTMDMMGQSMEMVLKRAE
jgi:hypothetical protein